MALKQPQPEVKQGAPEWMVTFADLMSLLLTFFVLLLSFSTMEIEKFNNALGSIRSAFGMKSPIAPINRPMADRLLPASSPSPNHRDTQVDDRLMIVKLREAIEKSGFEQESQVKMTERGALLQIDGDVVFASGDTTLQPQAHELLDRMGAIAKSSGGTIEVHGHTDDVPVRSVQYPSNWELSAARAGSAVRYLTAGGVPPSRLRATGFADTRPVAPNDSPQNRAKNRRVEFLFVSAEKVE